MSLSFKQQCTLLKPSNVHVHVHFYVYGLMMGIAVSKEHHKIQELTTSSPSFPYP